MQHQVQTIARDASASNGQDSGGIVLMERDPNVCDMLLLSYFTSDELAKLSIPQLRLMEALGHESMPDKLVYLDDDFRTVHPEHGVATNNELPDKSDGSTIQNRKDHKQETKPSISTSTAKTTKYRRYNKGQRRARSQKSRSSQKDDTSTLGQLSLLADQVI